MIYVGAAFDEGYMGKMSQYQFLETLDQLGSFHSGSVRCFAQIMDGKEPLLSQLHEKFTNITFVCVPKKSYKLQEQMKILACPQYGAFLQFMGELNDNDYVFFVDGDITIQRPFTNDELTAFTLSPETCLLSLNGRGDHSMREELLAMCPEKKDTLWQFHQSFGNIDTMKVYNCGVIGMSALNWKRLLNDYTSLFSWASRMLTHHASVQWFISYIINTRGYKIYDPFTDFVKDIHVNCHEDTSIQFFGLKRHPQTRQIFRQNGSLPMFAHAHLHPRWQHLL